LETGGLAIDPAGDLFVLDGAFDSGQVTEITADGAERTFASGFEYPSSIVYAVPEPAPIVLMASAAALLACFWAKRRWPCLLPISIRDVGELRRAMPAGS
jgi:hypothetical protein